MSQIKVEESLESRIEIRTGGEPVRNGIRTDSDLILNRFRTKKPPHQGRL